MKTSLYHFFYRNIGEHEVWLFCGVFTEEQANETIYELKKNNPTLDYIYYKRVD